MVFPILPIIAQAGLVGSGQANLYTQHNQRHLYANYEKAYRNLDRGYRSYLSHHGRQINPNRAWTSYFGQAESMRNNIQNSLAGSVGTAFGSAGATAFATKSLYREIGHSSRWL